MSITHSNTESTCDITYALYVRETVSNDWVDAGTDNTVYYFINNFDTASGTLQVEAQTADSLQTNYTMKIVVTSTETLDSNVERE